MHRLPFSLASAWLITGALASCTVSRPEGAYTPQPIQEPPDNDAGFQGVDGSTTAPPPPAMPPGGDPPPPPPPPPPTGGTGGEGDAGTDAGMTGPSAADLPYLALTGRYLMRADMYNVASVKQVGVSLKVANSATYFSVAQVNFEVATKKFEMTERLCYQQFQHECQDGCDTWKSQIDARATPFFPYVKRPLTLANNVLKGTVVSAALGFTGGDVNVLPQDDADERVWDLGGGASIREGVLTSINATGVAPLNNNINCEVYTVQRFTSSFDAMLINGKLEGVSTDFKTAGSDAYRVGATGTNASSCRSQTGDLLPGLKPDIVRFHRVADGAYTDERFWACPVAKDFSDALPPK